MIGLALAILPLLLIELIWQPKGWLRWTIDIGFAVIWLAFVVEFVLKIAIAESRVEYVRRNWLDLVIIAVPILRPLRLKAGMVRTTRVFKLRGVGMKFFRYFFTVIIGMEATERLLERVGFKRQRGEKDPTRMTRYELMDEVRRHRRAAEQWESWYEAHMDYLREHDGPPDETPPPQTPRPDPQTPPPGPRPDLQSPPCALPSRSSTRPSAT
jgi:hypothetical protein